MSGDETSEPERIAAALGLESLPHEGGRYRRTHIDEHSSAIYYLLAGDDFSALHVLDGPEVYHWYAGAPLRLLLLEPDGVREPLLGPDLADGQSPQLVVPAGVWHGSSSAGDWTLIGTTMAPPFRWEGFRLGSRSELSAQYPEASAHIAELTREP